MWVKWDITERCNLNCLHCYQSGGHDDLSTEEAKSLIDEFSQCFVTRIHFFGGEPLLRGDFMNLARYCNDKGISIGFTSNGQIVSEELAQELAELNFDSISVSLDGASAETNDQIRGPGTFDKAIAALRHLRSALHSRSVGTLLNIATTLSMHNYEEADQLIPLAHELGVSSVTYATVRIEGNANSNASRFRISPSDLYSAIQNIALQSCAYRSSLKVNLPVPPMVRDHLTSKYEIELECVHERYCIGGLGEVRITSSGLVYPCIDGREAYDEILANSGHNSVTANDLKHRSFRECFYDRTMDTFCRITHCDLSCRMAKICDECRYRIAGECWPVCGARPMERTSQLYQLCELTGQRPVL